MNRSIRQMVYPMKHTPAQAIKPRRMDFEFTDDIPTWWFGGDVFKTILMTAQSCTFPDGERFFIDSVRHYQSQITDPELAARVRGFIGQEAHHGKEHGALNDFMSRQGLPTQEVADHVNRNLRELKKRMSPQAQLAMTCALEHFTALLAELALSEPDFFDGMDERVKVLWLWHAIEESEHKSVAFDVYKAVVGDEKLLRRQMVINTITFLFFSAVHFRTLYRKSPKKIGTLGILKGIDFLVGREGWLRRLTPRYLAYFRKDFHPSEVDTEALRNEVMEQLHSMTGKTAFAAAA